MIKFQKQDLALLKYLHAVKVATYKQIHRDIYPEYSFRSVRNRVIKLSHHGLVSGNHDRLGLIDGKSLSLTKKGFTQFVSNGEETRIELKSEALQHDIDLVDIRASFLRIPRFLEYHTENQIQTWWQLSHDDLAKKSMVHINSDALALVSFKKDNLWVAIEYESAAKSAARYEPVVKKYYANQDITLILYVCSEQCILNKIMKAEKQLYDSEYPKFFYQLKQKLTSSEALVFYNFNNRILQFEAAASDA